MQIRRCATKALRTHKSAEKWNLSKWQRLYKEAFTVTPHRVHLAWWLSRTVYVPRGLEFEPQRLRGFSDFQGFK